MLVEKLLSCPRIRPQKISLAVLFKSITMSDYVSKGFAKEIEDVMMKGRGHHDENAVSEHHGKIWPRLTHFPEVWLRKRAFAYRNHGEGSQCVHSWNISMRYQADCNTGTMPISGELFEQLYLSTECEPGRRSAQEIRQSDTISHWLPDTMEPSC